MSDVTDPAELFSLPEDSVYLNAAFVTPFPRPVEEAGVEAIRRFRAPLDLGPEDFFRDADRIRELFAGLVHADEPSRVAIVPAVSYGASLVARNLELEADQSVVVAAEQFPSNYYPWQALARRTGAELRSVERPEGAPLPGPGEGNPVPGAAELRSGGRTAAPEKGWTGRILGAIDGTTGLVALPQAHWTDGCVFDLEAIGERAREVGAAFVVDGTQTVGAHPFRVDRIRPDALLCAGYKWLLGPYGLGVAYLGPRFDDGHPLEETWLGRRGSEDLGRLTDYVDDYRDDASRFDVGERSSFQLAPMLVAALGLMAEWGVEAVAAHCDGLNRRLAAGARELGFRVPGDDLRCSNIVGLIAPPGVDMGPVAAELQARGIHVSRRGDALRVSPHVYNDEGDVDALLEALEAAL